ncbi:MAG: hypothetical protein ACYDEZ_09690 [Methanoregula sp.]
MVKSFSLFTIFAPVTGDARRMTIGDAKGCPAKFFKRTVYRTWIMAVCTVLLSCGGGGEGAQPIRAV